MYTLALRRKLALAVAGDYDPYPARPDGARLSPFEEHAAALATAPLALTWAQAGGDAAAWQRRVRAKLAELAGWRRPERVTVLRREDAPAPAPGLRRVRFYLRAWPGADVPVDVVWGEVAEPAPVMLCLQGTNAGAHLSWGEARMPPDPVKIAAGLDFARQAAGQGYVAVCVEQRCFGERRERALMPRSADPCIDAFLHGLLFGRTLLGARAGDVSAVLDWLLAGGLDAGPAIDRARVHVMGHSAGGTVAAHAAALDERLTAVIASGCLGPVCDTIARRRDGAGQNTIPGQLNWFELSDVVALCAPRPLLAVSGETDHVFPFAGAARVVADARPVYEALGAAARLGALAIPGGHRFDPGLTWPAFTALLDK